MNKVLAHLVVASLVLVSIVKFTEKPLYGSESIEIKIYHVQRLISEIGSDCCDSSGKTLDVSPTFSAKKGSTVRISIVDANPLLFQYSLKKGAAVQTSNAKALSTFTDSLDTFVSSLSGSIKSAAANASTSLTTQANLAESRSASAPPMPRTLDCESAINTLVDVGTQIDSFVKQRAAIASQSLRDHSGAKAAVAAWKLDDLGSKLKTANQGLDTLTAMLLPSPRSEGEEQCRSVVALASIQAVKIGKALDSLNEFARLVGQIDDPITLPPFTVNINEDQPIELTISKSENFPLGLSDKALFIGDTTFTVSPFSRVNILPGAGVVYSFVRAPIFSAVSSGGQFIIKQTKNEYNKVDGAVTLQVEPIGWDLGPLNLGVQLGVSPKTDIGLFLGLSGRFAGFFTIAVGGAFQRQDQLATGLAVGQVIATQDQLKTEKVFRSGFYVNFVVTPKK